MMTTTTTTIIITVDSAHSTLILGIFPSKNIADIGGQSEHVPYRLFSQEIIFEVFQPM